MWQPPQVRWWLQGSLFALLAASWGCAFDRSKVAPFIGAVAGGTTGAAVGNIPGAAIGTTLGYGSGVAYDWAAQPGTKDTIETIEALSEGDIAALLEKKLEKHNTATDNFMDDIKQVLIYAAAGLAIYLTIPLLYAKRCQKQAEQKLTRAPFPTRKPNEPVRPSEQ